MQTDDHYQAADIDDEALGQPRSGLSTGAKVGIGCGAGCLLILILIGIGSCMAYNFVVDKITAWEQEFADKGFTDSVEAPFGQEYILTETLTEPTVIKAQTVKIQADQTVDLAIIAQMCEIDAKLEGMTYFRGQMIAIHTRAQLAGLDVEAQVVNVMGTVDGEITGEWQVIQHGGPSAPGVIEGERDPGASGDTAPETAPAQPEDSDDASPAETVPAESSGDE